MNISDNDVKNAYQRAISKVWGIKQKDIKEDIHIGSRAPGQWSPRSAVEIYCEGDIPNATDANYSEFGTVYHSEMWFKIDDMANQFIQKKHPGAIRYHYEPYNDAVINVYKN
jgi:hypothetical protein|tara:strand:- start:1240 stop:1575 length:336 start_codon:yes stop_codon:yes gene_type:complete